MSVTVTWRRSGVLSFNFCGQLYSQWGYKKPGGSRASPQYYLPAVLKEYPEALPLLWTGDVADKSYIEPMKGTRQNVGASVEQCWPRGLRTRVQFGFGHSNMAESNCSTARRAVGCDRNCSTLKLNVGGFNETVGLLILTMFSAANGNTCRTSNGKVTAHRVICCFYIAPRAMGSRQFKLQDVVVLSTWSLLTTLSRCSPWHCMLSYMPNS